MLKLAGVRNIVKLDLNFFRLDRVLKLIRESHDFDTIFILCNAEMLHKIRQLIHELSLEISGVEFNIITINSIDDNEVIIAW